MKPVTNKMTRGFGNGHNGRDYACPVGTPVRATESGVVTFEGWGQNHSWMRWQAGICILVKHKGHYSGYAHLSRTIVDKGQRVSKGQVIGYSGNTGHVLPRPIKYLPFTKNWGAHLHYETLPLNPNFSNGYSGRVNPAIYEVVAPKPVKKKPAAKKYHVVKSGDTMSGIAARYKTTLAKLSKLNPKIKNLNLISVGQKVRIK